MVRLSDMIFNILNYVKSNRLKSSFRNNALEIYLNFLVNIIIILIEIKLEFCLIYIGIFWFVHLN